jgi:hypothetical protein
MRLCRLALLSRLHPTWAREHKRPKRVGVAAPVLPEAPYHSPSGARVGPGPAEGRWASAPRLTWCLAEMRPAGASVTASRLDPERWRASPEECARSPTSVWPEKRCHYEEDLYRTTVIGTATVTALGPLSAHNVRTENRYIITS